jgi:hypothetical protein
MITRGKPKKLGVETAPKLLFSLYLPYKKTED